MVTMREPLRNEVLLEGHRIQEPAEELKTRENHRWSRARRRILLMLVSAVVRPTLFFLTLTYLMGHVLDPYRLRVIGFLIFFAVMPVIFVQTNAGRGFA